MGFGGGADAAIIGVGYSYARVIVGNLRNLCIQEKAFVSVAVEGGCAATIEKGRRFSLDNGVEASGVIDIIILGRILVESGVVVDDRP